MTLRRTKRSLPIALLRARETVMAPVRVMLAQTGISEQKWRVIRVLAERGPMEQTTLAQEACLLLPSLTRMLRSMEEEGLLTRASDTLDRRKSIVTLTAAGQAILDDHAGSSAAIAEELAERFGAAKLEQLLDLLEELNERDDKDSGR